jgi:hypothetical protein
MIIHFFSRQEEKKNVDLSIPSISYISKPILAYDLIFHQTLIQGQRLLGNSFS